MSTKRNLFRRIAQLTAREVRTTDHIVVTGADGHDALIPIADITDVDPVESASQIAAIRVETTDGTQHSTTPEELATALASQPVLIGPVGPKGDKGDKGDTGAVGPVGATGPQGIAGKDAGMDYSIRTEQIVPGEYWLDFDGVRRPVRTTTIYAVIPNGYTPIAEGRINELNSPAFGVAAVISLISVEGCRIDNNFLTSDYSWQDDIHNVAKARLQGRGWGRFVAFYGAAHTHPCTFIIKLKYTRD